MTFTFTRWVPLLGLSLFAALAVWLLRPPAPLPVTAPASEFAAGRALADVAVIARAPHAIGTPANAAVRDYLLGRLRALGLADVRVQEGVGVGGFGSFVQVGRVQNVLARLPGRVSGPAVLVLAHYDSQPNAPGAGDDGAGVAAMLETIRALKAGPPLTHDVIWLFTDGEEAGLLGARAYAADTVRLRREVGVVLNVEGRGNQGPVLMFEVSGQNGWVIEQLAQAAPAPLASSLFYEAYKRLPNDTDFTPLRQAGLTGLNFAFVGGHPYYHSPADTPAHLDPASVQHHGAYLLALVRHFGSISLAQTKAPDATFFNPLGTWLVRYPAAWGLPLTAGTLALLLLTLALARQRGRLSWLGLVGGVAAWLGTLVLVLGLGWGLLSAVAWAYPQYGAFYDREFYNAGAYQVALLALGLGVFSGVYAVAARLVRPDALSGGALVAVAVLLGLMQWRASSSSFLLAWPLLAATLGWLPRLRRPGPAYAARPNGSAGGAGGGGGALVGAVSWALLLPAVALLAPVTQLLLVIFGLSNLALVASLLLLLLLGLLLPLLLPALRAPVGPSQRPATSLALPALALLTVGGALGWGHLSRQPTPDQPQQSHLFYVLNASRQRADWVSAAPRPDAWTARVLSAPRYDSVPALAPFAGPTLHQSAPLLPLPAPDATVLTDSLAQGRRHLRLLLRPGRPAVNSLSLTLRGPRPLALVLAGHALPLAPARPKTGADGARPGTPDLNLLVFAPRPAGEVLTLTLPDAGPLTFTLSSRSLGVPVAAGPLPAGFVASPGHNSSTTQVQRGFRL